MSWKNTSNRYGTLSIGLHWIMLLLLIAVYASINLRELYPKGSDLREALKTWHFMLGLCVFALVSLRIYARLSEPTPSITPEPMPWQSLSANVMHIALYALMIGMPLLGWLLLSANGKPIPFFVKKDSKSRRLRSFLYKFLFRLFRIYQYIPCLLF